MGAQYIFISLANQRITISTLRIYIILFVKFDYFYCLCGQKFKNVFTTKIPRVIHDLNSGIIDFLQTNNTISHNIKSNYQLQQNGVLAGVIRDDNNGATVLIRLSSRRWFINGTEFSRKNEHVLLLSWPPASKPTEPSLDANADNMEEADIPIPPTAIETHLERPPAADGNVDNNKEPLIVNSSLNDTPTQIPIITATAHPPE